MLYLKVVEKLGLSYKNSQELNAIIDKKLPNHPKFHHSEVVIAGEVFEMYSQNIIDASSHFLVTQTLHHSFYLLLDEGAQGLSTLLFTDFA